MNGEKNLVLNSDFIYIYIYIALE